MALFAFALHLPGVWGDYTLDDFHAVLGHPAVTGEVPWWEVFVREFWGRPLTEGWSSSYRPLTTLSFALTHRLSPNAWLHHLFNVLAYAVLCGLFVRFTRRWCSPWVAIGIGVSFAALPIHVENVASVVGRADVLASIAALLALELLLSRRHAQTRSAILIGFSAGTAYLVALMFKETVALLPALGAWLVWLEIRAGRTERRAFIAVLVIAGFGLIYLGTRQALLRVELPPEFIAADNLLLHRHGLMRVWGNLAVLGHYAELVFVPFRLCADHTYADIIPPTRLFERDAAWSWLGLLVLCVLIRDAVRAVSGRGPGLGVATALAYLLVGQWVIDLSVIVAERLALWPSLWLLLAMSAAIDTPLARLDARRRRRTGLLFALLVGLASARTVDRTLDWRDTVALQRSSLESCPRAVHSRFILANAMRERGEAAEAVWHYAVAGAGRAAFPERFDIPALTAEREQLLADRLLALPELVGADDAERYWASLHGYLVSQGAWREAEVVRRLALGVTP